MVKEYDGKAFAQKCDVSNKEEVYRMADKVREVAGDVTILINNAGIVYGQGIMEPKDSEIERTMNVNALAHFWTVRAFLPSMLENNHGHIVTVSSVMGYSAAAGMTSYVASKHASFGFNNALELDLRSMKKDGVKTTVICPYHITTGLFSGVGLRFPSFLPSLKPEECVEGIMHGVLTNRTMVAMPRYMYFTYNMLTWIPHKAALLLSDFLGTGEAMSNFVPNREYQKEESEGA